MVHIIIPINKDDQIQYKGRKWIPTTNVLPICDFDLIFTYVLARWKGLAHDTCIFLTRLVIQISNSNNSHPVVQKICIM